MMNAIVGRLPLERLRWWALGFLGLCLGHACLTLWTLNGWWLLPLLGLWLALAWTFRWGAPRHPRPPRRLWPWSLVPLGLWWLYLYLADSFGKVDLAAVFFHLQAGIADHGGTERMLDAVLYTLAALLNMAAFTWLVRHDHRWRLIERLLALALLAANPLLFGITQRSAAIVTEDGAWLDRRYVPPEIVATPAGPPPNLLVIYLESLERTYGDPQRFGDAYAPLAELGERAVVFEGVRQADNTGWTMAGMIASQCGTPLMPAGLLHDTQFEPLDRVVPGVDCLGNLLADEGYRLSYIGGASTDFAGKGIFYRDHGFDRVLGREELEGRLGDPSYLNSWGLFDDSLYEMAFDEIRRLDAEPGPWGMVALTLGSHAPHGFPAQSCRDRQGEPDGADILYAVECSARLTRDFLSRLEAEGLLDDTLVVIASDHLTMKVEVWEQLIAGPRENTFMLIGNGLAPRHVKREASTLDIFPTVLEAMGFRLASQHRAGLGVSLLSPSATLVERHGLERLNVKLREEKALQERLWDGLHPQQAEEPASSRADDALPKQVTETPADATQEASETLP